MRQISLLCRWWPVQSVCELVPVPPMRAYRYDRYILQTELPAEVAEGTSGGRWVGEPPRLDGLEALLIE